MLWVLGVCLLVLLVLLVLIACRTVPGMECHDSSAWADHWKRHCTDVYFGNILNGKHAVVTMPGGAGDARAILTETQRALQSGHVSLSSTRHEHYPTTDVPVCHTTLPHAHRLTRRLLDRTVRPAVARLFGVDAGTISYQEAFVAKYAAHEQRALAAHRDGSPLSFVCALNDGFEGGGTRFVDTGQVCRPRPGQCCIFAGTREHEGVPVTRGERWILTGFVNWGPTSRECSKLFEAFP